MYQLSYWENPIKIIRAASPFCQADTPIIERGVMYQYSYFTFTLKIIRAGGCQPL